MPAVIDSKVHGFCLKNSVQCFIKKEGSQQKMHAGSVTFGVESVEKRPKTFFELKSPGVC